MEIEEEDFPLKTLRPRDGDRINLFNAHNVVINAPLTQPVVPPRKKDYQPDG